MSPYKIKCRYCQYEVLSWYKTKNGNVHSGMRALRRHIEDDHPEIAAVIYLNPNNWDEEEVQFL